ncbi:hypothetical protein D5F52_17570 [Brevibacillus laterosporus]|nr:hypothetical protein BrL25_12820 [Brevibacillus laterosporus DSM 25]AYB39925.1 hypothetical protein D5F52_17570 [Brevibacillus laterosporus]MBG9802789.1 hypothetical protein [Brevibacillus laterosporus]MBM7110572.1 hypothetical protein [Brevibacillus laterosporus]TPH18373.1 hypothetical protein EGH09_08495 [Brevibacillus laterosporus]
MANEKKYSMFIFFVFISLFIKLNYWVDFLLVNFYLATVIELLVIFLIITLFDSFLTNAVKSFCEKFKIKLFYLYLVYIVLYLLVFGLIIPLPA